MKTQRISFLSGLIVAITVPVILNAASLSWNPSKIAKDNGIVVLAEETAKPAAKARMNVDSNGVILKGYDPVAYFTRHQAVKGNPAIETRFGGAIYNFVSVADKVAFSKNPSIYVPRYGGFCAYHVSKGELKDSDPAVFFIFRGKLYVCSAADGAKEFRSNIDENPTRTGFRLAGRRDNPTTGAVLDDYRYCALRLACNHQRHPEEGGVSTA